MGTLLITLLFMLLIFLAMSIGVIFGRPPIKGSCGGVGQALGQKNYNCEICGGDEDKCEKEQRSGAD